LFFLGQIVATSAALACLDQSTSTIEMLLKRHQTGDWGNVHHEDASANNFAINAGLRIISSYALEETGQIIWIITEANRSVTTLLLPDDY